MFLSNLFNFCVKYFPFPYLMQIKNKNDVGVVVFNIFKACVGSGILTFPSLFQKYGCLLTTIYTIIFGIISLFSCILYTQVNHYYNKKDDIGTLALHDIKWIKLIVDITIFLKCYIVSFSYFILIFNILKEIKTYFTISTHIFEKICLTIIFIAIVPFILTKKITSLKSISMLGLFGSIILLCTSFIFYFNSKSFSGSANIYRTDRSIEDLSNFIFSYTCHQNILQVQNETSLSVIQLQIIILFVYIGVTLVYLAFGLINYFTFNSHKIIPAVVFEVWPNNYVKLISLIIYVLFLIVTIPLQIHPIKIQLIDLLSINNRFYQKLLGLLLITSIYIITIIDRYQFSSIIKFVSRTFSTGIVFIFSGIYYFATKDKKMHLLTYMAVISVFTGLLSLSTIIFYIVK